MKNFALIDEDNNIVNLVICDSLEIAQDLFVGLTCIEYNIEENLLDLTWTYDGENFIQPEQPDQIPLDPPISQEHPDSIPGETRTDL
jgi:hypothetical protein